MRFIKLSLICLLFLALGPQLAFAKPSGIPTDGTIMFDVLRNGKPFGTHTLTFTKDGSAVKIDIAINLAVAAGPIQLYSYSHNNTERWVGNQLVSISAETNDDGKLYAVNGTQGDGRMNIQSSSSNFAVKGPLVSSSYWNKAMLDAPSILNTQKGRLDPISVEKKGIETKIVGDQPRQAQRYRVNMKDETTVDVWYDTLTNQWVGLDFSIRGSRVTYKRTDPI